MTKRSSFVKLMVNPKTEALDMNYNGLLVINYLKHEPFFMRFPDQILNQYLTGAKPEIFQKHDVIILMNRVGIVCSGSVRMF